MKLFEYMQVMVPSQSQTIYSRGNDGRFQHQNREIQSLYSGQFMLKKQTILTSIKIQVTEGVFSFKSFLKLVNFKHGISSVFLLSVLTPGMPLLV